MKKLDEKRKFLLSVHGFHKAVTEISEGFVLSICDPEGSNLPKSDGELDYGESAKHFLSLIKQVTAECEKSLAPLTDSKIKLVKPVILGG